MSTVLFVYAKGGPPLGYALSRVAARSAVHLLALSTLPSTAAPAAERLCASVVNPDRAERDDLVSLIVSRAEAVGADAIVTFSEYAVVAVAEACAKLGLAGAGGSSALARDKRLMRRAWMQRGISQPRFRPVADEQEFRAAAGTLCLPLLLKSAWSAGSTAHQIIRSADEIPAAWDRANAVMAESAELGYAELHVAGAGADFLVEEIVVGTADGWFGQSGWGDYVSVEGVVADGEFRPVCLTGRMPTVPPFTERAGITPAPLPDDAQRRIVALAREAVDALGLENCGTHTEVKLGADGRMWVIETAARFGGAMTVPQIEEVFGLDLIGMLVDHLLGRPVVWPAQALTSQEARGAAGSLVVLAVDAAGNAWPDRRVWDFPTVRDTLPVSAAGRLSVVADNSLPDGAPVPVYDPTAGANTMAALCLLSATDPGAVLRDFQALVHALPKILPLAGATEARS
ncbi:ATP-grasp domain-containing protein [Streptomyces sp. NPDC048483]|uniref:ATP-grasp domain-containing protein n=1 Tax=Streptomyces sp. NPDC048483 TaxID=3154927 RepID=UPI0034333699